MLGLYRDILYSLLFRLKVEDIMAVAKSCRSLYSLIRKDDFWTGYTKNKNVTYNTSYLFFQDQSSIVTLDSGTVRENDIWTLYGENWIPFSLAYYNISQNPQKLVLVPITLEGPIYSFRLEFKASPIITNPIVANPIVANYIVMTQTTEDETPLGFSYHDHIFTNGAFQFTQQFRVYPYQHKLILNLDETDVGVGFGSRIRKRGYVTLKNSCLIASRNRITQPGDHILTTLNIRSFSKRN